MSSFSNNNWVSFATMFRWAASLCKTACKLVRRTTRVKMSIQIHGLCVLKSQNWSKVFQTATATPSSSGCVVCDSFSLVGKVPWSGLPITWCFHVACPRKTWRLPSHNKTINLSNANTNMLTIPLRLGPVPSFTLGFNFRVGWFFSELRACLQLFL